MTQQIVYYDDGTQQTLVTPGGYILPRGRKFARLRHDYEVYGVSRPTRNKAANHVLGLPETIKVLEPAFVPLTEAWQWFTVDLLSLARYGALYKQIGPTSQSIIRNVFRGTYLGYRAFSNKHGPDNGYRDYVNNVNRDASPIEQETINTGGNVVEILDGPLSKGGKQVYKVRTMDANQPPPNPLQVNHLLAPWLIVRATNSQREKIMSGRVWTGRWIEDIVEAFPQNDGRDNPIPFLAKGPFNYIVSERIELLMDSSSVPNPYHKHQE